MFFTSDNSSGACETVLSAVTQAMRQGLVPSYGGDELTRQAEAKLSALFETPCTVFLLTSGTAANALALAHITPPWGAVFAHSEAHILTSECGAVEFFSTARLVGLPGINGKVTPEKLAAELAFLRIEDPHGVQPAALSLTNLTECGTLYTPQEIAALSRMARDHAMAVHLDGARFANAVAALGCSPADLSWRAGVDVMSLGATKNGAIAAEAVIFFDPTRAKDFKFRRMRSGHLLSKHRFIAAQYLAWLEEGLWLRLAGHANAMAQRLAQGFGTQGHKLAFPCEGNEVFVFLDFATQERLREKGAMFYDWPSRSSFTSTEDTATLCRFVCSFATHADEVADFLKLLANQ